ESTIQTLHKEHQYIGSGADGPYLRRMHCMHKREARVGKFSFRIEHPLHHWNGFLRRHPVELRDTTSLELSAKSFGGIENGILRKHEILEAADIGETQRVGALRVQSQRPEDQPSHQYPVGDHTRLRCATGNHRTHNSRKEPPPGAEDQSLGRKETRCKSCP